MKGQVKTPKGIPTRNVRVLELTPQSMIVIRHPAGMGDESFTKAMQQFADEMPFPVAMLAVNSLKEVKVMDEDEMERVGWIHKSRVYMTKSEYADMYAQAREAAKEAAGSDEEE